MNTFAIVLFLFLGAVSYTKGDGYLVSMKKAEFLSIVECISISKDPVLCEKYAKCEKEMPYRIFAAVEKCQKEHVGDKVLRCTKHEPLYKNPAVPALIFDCVAEAVKKLHEAEKEKMIKFEECAKKLKEESCKVVASHGHHHHHTHRKFHHMS